MIRSWDFVRKGCDWKFPVIIDNMMNLELLLSMSKAYADDSLQNIACTHANTTIQHHFRDDYSTYHLVDYDPETGAVRGKQQCRLLGRFLLEPRTGMGLVQLYDDVPLDGVSELSVASRTYCRYAAPPFACRRYSLLGFRRSGRRTDLSGCFRCGYHGLRFIELSRYIPGTDAKESYLAMAEKQLRTLASKEYLAEPGTNECFILKHSVGALPDKSEVDVPLTYADYYFLEALLRYKNLQK